MGNVNWQIPLSLYLSIRGLGGVMGWLQLRRCRQCKRSKHFKEFRRAQSELDGRAPMCRECEQVAARVKAKISAMRRHVVNTAKRLWTSSRSRAKEDKLEHTISVSDIVLPKLCPYLGVPLDYRHPILRGSRRSFNSPSLDRIDNTKGYIPGNVQVISDLANRMKQDATIEQLIAFAHGVLRRHAARLPD
jgi:hypothetical protein